MSNWLIKWYRNFTSSSRDQLAQHSIKVSIIRWFYLLI